MKRNRIGISILVLVMLIGMALIPAAGAQKLTVYM